MKQGAAVQQNLRPGAGPAGSSQIGTAVTPPPIPEQPKREERRTPPKSIFASKRNQRPETGPAASAGPASRVMKSPPLTTKQDKDREPYFDEWKCPLCGTINNDYVTACSCGCTKRKAQHINAKKTALWDADKN